MSKLYIELAGIAVVNGVDREPFTRVRRYDVGRGQSRNGMKIGYTNSRRPLPRVAQGTPGNCFAFR